MDKTKKGWWKSAVMYQVYPKSFQDTNGDGYGDLNGITEHLDYLKDLGIDGIWLSPVYASPQKDNGYDISDYESIDPRVGTMQDMERLIAEADKRDITLIMDLVLNHTSHEHPWFLASKSAKDNPYHDYYIWRDGTPATPPNDARATFGGSAWTYVPEIGQWYFNQFSPWQPDLNWENPKVRKELYKMIRFWRDKGVGGFRLDVIENIGKIPDKKIGPNGPKLHDYIKEMRKEAFFGDTLITVGEAWSANVEIGKQYTNPDGSELSMIFQVEPILLDYGEQYDDLDGKWSLAPLPLPELKKTYERWQHGLYGRGWNSLFLENHDIPRVVSRWGDDGEYWRQSAKMLAAMAHCMQGTPWIYQGEEIGMTNISLDIDEYDDLEIRDAYEVLQRHGKTAEEALDAIRKRCRDNARTPMQWSDAEYAGFSNVKPWLPVNPNYKDINVQNEIKDPDSVYSFYKTLIRLRREYEDLFINGTFTLIDPDSEENFVYTRDTEHEHLLVVCNFTDKTIGNVLPERFENARVLLANYPDPQGRLRPYETRILYMKE